MGWRQRRNRKEQRAQPGGAQAEDPLLTALLGGGAVSKETALQVPTVAGGVDLIAGVVAGTPIKLYRDRDGRAEEVRDDPRLRLLNDETGDTLNANEFWRAMVRDYYLGKGGYAYIRKEGGRFQGLHYVDEAQVSISKNSDPIFKDFRLLVGGRAYQPFEFLRILRNTKDGAAGTPITVESARLIDTAYQSLCLERNASRKGGAKKGFLQAKKPLTAEALGELRAAYANLYSNDTDRMMVLNDGVTFQELSDTAAEMQLSENKAANALEFAKIFHVSTEAMAGRGDAVDAAGLAKLAAIPLMTVIQCALNRDFLLEREKGTYYWAFDTKELLKGDMKERFDAYKTALDANFMQIDEVRYAEDLEPLGLSWVKLGLQDVLYDPKTRRIYTPNTNKTGEMKENGVPAGQTESEEAEAAEKAEEAGKEGLPDGPKDGTIEARGNPYHDPKTGRFASGPGGRGGKRKRTKYAPSKQRSFSGVQLAPKKYSKLCGTLGTLYPGLKEGEIRQIRDAKKMYTIKADGYGGFKTLNVEKIK